MNKDEAAEMDQMDDQLSSTRNTLRRITSERDALLAKRAEAVDIYSRIMEETCPSDEYHCTCVPVLREEIEKLNKCLHSEAVMTNEMQSKYVEQVRKNELLMDGIEKIKNKSFLPNYDWQDLLDDIKSLQLEQTE